MSNKITEPVMLITINRLYKEDMDSEELYQVARGKWVVGPRRNKAKYVFAVYKKIIQQVYEIEEWSPVQIEKHEINRSWESPGSKNEIVKQLSRWQFEGKIAPELQHYIGENIETYSITPSQNPIRYINC